MSLTVHGTDQLRSESVLMPHLSDRYSGCQYRVIVVCECRLRLFHVHLTRVVSVEIGEHEIRAFAILGNVIAFTEYDR